MGSVRSLNVYWISRLIAGASSTAAPVVLTVATLSASVGARTLAALLTAQAVGQLIALGVSGAVIDRVNRRAFLVLVQALSGLTWAVFATISFFDLRRSVLWAATGAVLGLLAGLNGPATQSLLAFLVEQDSMKATIAKLRISLNVVALLSPVLAGIAMAMLQVAVVPLVMALMMLASSATLITLPGFRSVSSPVGSRGQFKDVFQSWFIIVLLATSALNILWAGFFQLRGPLVVVGSDGSGAAQWGIVSASLTAGLIAGGFYYRRKVFKDPIGSPLLLLAPKALPILVIAVFPNIAVLAVATFVAGFFLEAFAVNFYTQVQLRIPEHALGKALSLDGFIGIGLLPVGYAMAEAAERAGNAEFAGVLAAIGTLALAMVGWVLLRAFHPPDG